jgi:hypothetical protein
MVDKVGLQSIMCEKIVCVEELMHKRSGELVICHDSPTPLTSLSDFGRKGNLASLNTLYS